MNNKNNIPILYIPNNEGFECLIVSLQSLFNSNIENYYFAGVEDVYCKENCERLNLSQYCNAGVMLINLNLWRKDAIKEKLFNWALVNKEKIKWVDQDVINSVLQEKILYLNDKFNTQVSVLEFGKTKDNNKKACQSTIIHFVGCEKPWQKKNFILYKYYWKYIFRLPGQYSWKWNYIKCQIQHFRKFIIQLKLARTEQYLRIFNFTIFERKRGV